MNDFEWEWDLAMALEVLQSPRVDGATWAAAVKWLLFYGPPELCALIAQASQCATSEHFPHLKAAGYDEAGAPCYDRRELAAALGLAEDELARQMAEWESEAGDPRTITPPKAHRVQ